MHSTPNKFAIAYLLLSNIWTSKLFLTLNNYMLFNKDNLLHLFFVLLVVHFHNIFPQGWLTKWKLSVPIVLLDIAKLSNKRINQFWSQLKYTKMPVSLHCADRMCSPICVRPKKKKSSQYYWTLYFSKYEWIWIFVHVFECQFYLILWIFCSYLFSLFHWAFSLSSLNF